MKQFTSRDIQRETKAFLDFLETGEDCFVRGFVIHKKVPTCSPAVHVEEEPEYEEEEEMTQCDFCGEYKNDLKIKYEEDNPDGHPVCYECMERFFGKFAKSQWNKLQPYK